MNSVRSQIAARYAALGSQEQVLLLARLGGRLTLEGRDTYDDRGGVADSVRLRAFNEAQHRISGQLLRLLTADERRYPDDVFANILADQFQGLNLDPEGILKFLDETATEHAAPAGVRGPKA